MRSGTREIPGGRNKRVRIVGFREKPPSLWQMIVFDPKFARRENEFNRRLALANAASQLQSIHRARHFDVC